MSRSAVAFDPTAYWTRTASGTEDMMPFSPIAPEHAVQEDVLRDLLTGLDFGSVLEVGCGLGRITLMLADLTDDLSAIDIGTDQVLVTRKRVPKAVVMQSSIQDFEADRQWDLVLASEVLMHIPPAEIRAVCDKLKHLSSRWIVTVDWTEPIEGPIGKHNWLHDYSVLFGGIESVIRIGRQTVFVVAADDR